MIRYVAFEGLDGSGKSILSEKLALKLNMLGHKVRLTREPGSPHIALKVRDFLLGHDKISPKALELLFQADRAEHTAWVKQQLAEGYYIISDRSYMSGLAYALSNGHNMAKLLNIADYSIEVKPDVIFMTECSPETSMARVAAKKSNTREEARGGEARKHIYDCYHRVCSILEDKYFQEIVAVDTETSTVDKSFEVICTRLGI